MELFGNRRVLMDGRAEVTAAGAGAKNTSAYTYGAVSVWAAKPSIQCNFITFLSKSVLEVGVKRIVGFVQPQGVVFCHKKPSFRIIMKYVMIVEHFCKKGKSLNKTNILEICRKL